MNNVSKQLLAPKGGKVLSSSEYWGYQILIAILLFWPLFYAAIFTFIYRARTKKIKILFFSVVVIAFGMEGIFGSFLQILEIINSALISGNVDNILSRSTSAVENYSFIVLVILSLISAFFVSRYFVLNILTEKEQNPY